MADAYVQVPDDTPNTGKKIDNDSLTVGGNVAYRQRIRTAGGAAAELQDVRNSAPGASDYGSVVRVGDGHSVVEGATTDAAVTTNAAGTLSAKLRGLVALLSAVSKLEDSVAADGDAGIAALAVRQDNLQPTVSATGDYATLAVDQNGRLWVNAESGTGPGQDRLRNLLLAQQVQIAATSQAGFVPLETPTFLAGG